ncbi:unnamed protein product [Lactuca saligna]|uniref:Beta-galactosidase n=1 Tax=Lactuca saligna TaxID=75948 RepID=A0AA35YLH0_LACSI|nr:unnamed protein product [Lactuca saligna]
MVTVLKLRGSSPNSSRMSLVIHPFVSMSATEQGCVYVVDAYKIYWTSCLKGSLSGKMVMRLVEAIDVYLARTVILIFAVGLYGFFISNAPNSIAPEDDRAIKVFDLYWTCNGTITDYRNEASYGPNHVVLAGWIRGKDPSRVLHYEYWETIDSTFGLQGGFIWDWVDQGLLKENANGSKYWA